MSLHFKLYPNLYKDSVSLMQLSARISGLEGVEQASVAMATEANIERMRPQIEASLPPGVDPTRFTRVVMNALQNMPELLDPQVDRQSVDPNKLRFGRFFFDGDGFQTVQEVGIVRPGESFHFRYMASVQTPGTWVQPGTDVDFEAKWEANARWARLVALGSPVGSA